MFLHVADGLDTIIAGFEKYRGGVVEIASVKIAKAFSAFNGFS